QVKALQDAIAAKEAQARQIYADTDAAFAAADQQKGAAGIAAGNKAMADRAPAEALMAEAAMLGPELAEAQGKRDLAKVALESAQDLAKLSQEASKQSQAAVTQIADR